MPMRPGPRVRLKPTNHTHSYYAIYNLDPECAKLVIDYLEGRVGVYRVRRSGCRVTDVPQELKVMVTSVVAPDWYVNVVTAARARALAERQRTGSM